MENNNNGRRKNSALNIVFALANSLGAGILRFVLRTIFIKFLGETILGVNGLFTNVLSILSLTDLGIGTAISFSLYKPLAENDDKKVAGLMNFYKKAYRWIAATVFVIGIALLPFMSYLINDYDAVKVKVQYIDWVYILFLINTVITYLMAYKRTLIIADQKEYKISPIVILFNVLVTIAQILVIVLTRNFILYLITQVVFKIFENIFVNRYIDKRYEYISKYCDEPIGEEDKKSLFDNIKAMFTHKVGDICVYSTDNLIISKMINIDTVGFYSNYVMVITLLKSTIVMLFSNLTASLGNLIVTESDEKKKKIFDIMDFVGFVLYGYASIAILGIMNPLIKLWIGEKFLLSNFVLILVVVEFFLYGLRISVSTIKSAAGLYKPDRYIGLISSVINLIVSIVLAKPLGLEGVLIGTIVSAISMPIWYRPYLVYKHILHIPVSEYFKKMFVRILIFSVQALLVWICVVKNEIFDSNIIQLIYGFIVSSIIFILPIILLYRNKEEYKELKSMFKKVFGKVIKKKKQESIEN